MKFDILSFTLALGFIVAISFLLSFKRSVSLWYVLLLFFLIGFIDNMFHTLTVYYPGIQIISGESWNNSIYCNWSAKLYSIVFSILILIPLKNIITSRELGLKLQQDKNSTGFSLMFLAVIFILALTVGSLGQKGSFNSRVLLYTAIMPGLNEEII